MNSTLKYLIREPKTKTKNPSLLLMLHGYGSNEEDLFSFAEELPDNLLIVSLRAPLSLDFGGYAWYGLQIDASNNTVSNIPEALVAKETIIKFIDKLQEKFSFNPQKSFLMGFSQGSILSYAIALSFPKKITNIIALSGYINTDITTFSEKPSEDYKDLDFFCSHGTEDPIIPVKMARKAITTLEENTIKYMYKEYYTGHAVTPQNFSDFKNWISAILDK
jgi:phospholipase/carboxylesterase